jgi:hypothetical protein
VGFGAAYAVDLVTYGALFFAALMMHPMPPPDDPGRASGWTAVKEGFGYVRRNRLLQATFVIDLIAMIFGMPQALFTFLAVSQFHRGPEIVGFIRSGSRRRRARGGAHDRMGTQRPASRMGGDLGRDGVGRRDHRLRTRRREPPTRAAHAGPRGRG